jgi:hypothetical protein
MGREAEMKQILKWLVGLYLVIAVITFVSKSRNATQFVPVSADAE